MRTIERPTAATIELSEVKRLLERYNAEPDFLDRLRTEPSAIAAEMVLDWEPSLVLALVDRDVPTNPVADRWRDRIRELLLWREQIRREGRPDHPRLRAWRDRQVSRLQIDLGADRAHLIIHAPASFELAVGCSVGCWFCGISAGKLQAVFAHTPEHQASWRGMLAAVQRQMGEALKWGFCYWGTDPLDNPDYEKFCVDFHDVTGNFPQTTTALAHKDPARTKALIRLSESKGCRCNRFSVLTLGLMRRIMRDFSADELNLVELIAQNKESRLSKAEAGKARQANREEATVPGTIACVSGLLINVVEGRVRLVTPCHSDERHPDGFKTFADQRFADLTEFEDLLQEWCARLPLQVEELPKLRFAAELNVSIMEDGFGVGGTDQLQVRDTRRAAYLQALCRQIEEGGSDAETIALTLLYTQRVPSETTMTLLQQLFEKGVLDEETDLWDR